MGVNKEHKEFHAVDMSTGWETPAGYPAGIQQKILSGALDETNKRGSRSRLLRFAPGVYTTKPFVHEYWEEVYLVSGDLTVGNDEQGRRRRRRSRRTPTPRGRRGPIMGRSSRRTAACCSRSTISIRCDGDASPYGSVRRAQRNPASRSNCATRALRVVAGVLRLRPTKRGTPARDHARRSRRCRRA